jgi:hypothetical protein
MVRHVGRVPDAIEFVAFSDTNDFSSSFFLTAAFSLSRRSLLTIAGCYFPLRFLYVISGFSAVNYPRG